MNDLTTMDLPSEIELIAACCRWPQGKTRLTAIRAAAAGVRDWSYVCRLVECHRVWGLVYEGLTSAGIELPDDAKKYLSDHAAEFAQQNVVFAGEAIRLQRIFDAENILVVFYKGASLAQLAYGSIAYKHGKDIDLLVHPHQVPAACEVLKREAYVLVEPSPPPDVERLRLIVQYHRELIFAHATKKIQIELHWKLTKNLQLLRGVDASSPTEEVFISRRMAIRTLNEADLVSYLGVHGALHAWRRMKWLADFNAMVAKQSEADIIRLYRHSVDLGAAFCTGVGLMLCRRIFGLHIPDAVDGELRRSLRLKVLFALSMNAIRYKADEREFGLFVVLCGHGMHYVSEGYRRKFMETNLNIHYLKSRTFYYFYCVFYTVYLAFLYAGTCGLSILKRASSMAARRQRPPARLSEN